jgi:rod shape-determining protein MreD
MMRSFLKLAVLFILGTVCHWAGATFFSYLGLNVNLMLVFMIALCSVLPERAGYALAFLSGLFLDFFGTKLFGNNAFSFTVAACVVYSLRERFDFDNMFPQMLTVFVLTSIVGVINSILLLWFTANAMWPGLLGLLGGAFIGTIVAPLIFWAVRRWWLDNSYKRS